MKSKISISSMKLYDHRGCEGIVGLMYPCL